MGMQDIRRWSIFLTWAILAQHTAAIGTIDLKFYKYAGDGKDEGGNCCDSIFPWGCDNNPCDPFFYVCIDHLDGSTSDDDCHYMGQLRTGVIHERNHITFSNNIGGTANPMTKSLTTIPNNVRLKITVVDSDQANGHSVISRLIKTERDIIPGFNGNKGSYRDTTLKTNSRAELQVKIRTYCDRYYYGDTCTKYCKDNEGGHYTCSNTGDKVCNTGWKGDNCNVDIDECIIPSFCKNGATCNNLPGGYRCECADGFKGNFCQEVNHTCAVKPCLNGGSCTRNQTDYTCDCLPWWGGKTCADAVDTCASSPCLNNGTCIANNVTTPGYTCNCESSWTGSACNTSVETSTSTTSTPSTTTSPIHSTTPTTTVIYDLGDPYNITLLGEIDDTNINPLRTGLVKLIKDLGDIPGDVFVKVNLQIIPIRTGVTTTYVEFISTGEKGPIDLKKIDDIFNTNSDETINAYLPLPLYRPMDGSENQQAATRGTIDLKFYKYAGDGKDEGGNCCDSIFPWGCDNNPCDPFFYVCIDHLYGSTSDEDCHYMGQLRTGIIYERNHITFGNNIGGTANPMTKSLTTIPNNVRLKITVVDSDPANSHDVISRLIKTERDIIPSFNGNKGSYRDTTLKTNSRAELQVKIRTYCDRYYYGNTCTKYCKDNEGGHYTCSNTGDKVCNIGWKGDNCNVDIDECIIPSFCKNGATCNNLQGGYRCECADGFKGTFCQEVNHTCAVNPCLNGGSCTGNQTDYTCDCLPWWGGKTCADAVDMCASSPCLNNGTCIANNVTTPGYTCNCESSWTGSACNTSVESSTSTTTTPSTTTSPIQSTTPTTTVIYNLGDPYYITLLGEIDDTNIDPLRTGLVKLIKDLGDIPGDVSVKVKPQIIPIRTGVTTTYVEFFSTGEKGPIDPKKIDDIFNTNSDETINAYLPLPLYRPMEGPERQVSEGSWATDNWYAIVIPILAAVVIVTCIIAFLFASKRRKEKENSFMRSDSNVEPAHPSNMAFENVLYHETHRGLQSEVHDGEVTFNPPEREVARGACADDANPYQQPVQYDTPVKQPTCTPNGVQHYQNSNLAALDTRCEAGANDYTMFSDLDGAKCDGENPYQELDDVQAEKAAIAVGFRQEQDVSLPIDSDDDSEDEIDKIKRQIKEDISDA